MDLPAHLTRRQFSIASLSALGVSLLGVGGCKPKQKNSFRIGVLSPKSGLESQVGLACERGAKVAEIMLKDTFSDIEILYTDTESSVDVGRSKAEKLINEGAQILIGAHNSAVTAAIAQVCEQHQVPFLINISAATKLTEQRYQYVFRNFPTTDNLTSNGLRLMKELFQKTGHTPKTAALIYINDTYGQAMHASIMENFLPLNLPFELVETISYDPRTQDLSSEIAKVKSSKAELLIPVTRLNDAILMIRECVKQRYNPMGIISPGSPGMYEKAFYRTLGAYSENCITNTAWFNPKSSLTQKVTRAFEKIYPTEQFDLNVSFTFEAVWIAADAYRRAASKEAKALQQALKETNIVERVVCGGPISFDSKGQATNITSVSLQNQKGAPRIILPDHLQQDVPIFPFPSWQAH